MTVSASDEVDRMSPLLERQEKADPRAGSDPRGFFPPISMNQFWYYENTVGMISAQRIAHREERKNTQFLTAQKRTVQQYNIITVRVGIRR